MTIVERIKEVSKNKNLNLKSTAIKAGLSENAIYKWNTQKPNADALKAVADVLGVSVDYLLGNTDDMYANTDKPKLDIKEVAEEDSWDEYLSSDGRPLSEHDKKVLRALFGE